LTGSRLRQSPALRGAGLFCLSRNLESRHAPPTCLQREAWNQSGANGPFLEGKRLRATHRLKSGETLKFRSVPLTFRTYSADESTESARNRA